MEKRFLIDTNIFLDIFLNQQKNQICMEFLENHHNSLFISDFSLHSIGIILTHADKTELFKVFMNDILDTIPILKMPDIKYLDIVDVINDSKLDFDDSYQYLIAKNNELSLVTIDKDFRKIESHIDVIFL